MAHGALTIQQQVNVLARIWGNDREGYVFLPWIDGRSMDKESRKKSYHEGPAFEWPKDRARIEEYLSQHDRDDVYFAPCLFVDKRRIEQAAEVERTLWADLDEADPQLLEGTDDYRPTIAWESSPGRYQAVWLLDRPVTGLSWPGKENHRLTMYLGADPSGWDTTQLLRVPGRKNWKFNYKRENGGQPVQGQLLWEHGPRYTVDDFSGLPEITVVDTSEVDDLGMEAINAVDRFEVWGRVRLKLSMAVREYMAFRKESQITEEMDRSEIQWQIMRDLADAGCTVAEIIAVVQPTVWNKHKGRNDEFKRLKTAAVKAVGERSTDDGDAGGALEEIGADKPDIRWLNDVMAVRMRRPRWLVHNVWSEGGCGFIAGDPKSYKSWTALDLAVSIATGRPFLGDNQFNVVGGARPVLYLQEEDGEIVVRERLGLIVDGKCPTLHWEGHVSFEDGRVFWSPPTRRIPLGFHVRTGFVSSDPGWQQWLASTIQDGQFSTVVIDTMGTTAGDVDTDRAQDLMTKILKPMREISHQTGAAITVVHHNKKGTSGEARGGSRMLGSVALHAWVDDALYIHSRETKKDGTTKVRVERESKAATEHRWTLEIPRMGVDVHGNRTVWNPLVGLWDPSEGGVTGDADAGAPVAHGDAPTPRRGQRVAGMSALGKAKQLGAHAGRPVKIAYMAKVYDMTEGNMWKQVSVAIENGLLIGSRETGVYPAP